jgi:aryl-alcohol dehydrogenase-like predicted oxidoreductase
MRGDRGAGVSGPHARLGKLGRVCRLGLATRGNTRLEPGDVLEAIRRGVNYLNWCGQPDSLSAAVRELGAERRKVFLGVQLQARSAAGARSELDVMLKELGTTYLDVVTFYYVEEWSEWQEILAPGGAMEALEEATRRGVVRSLGITSHQRKLAARVAETRRIDLLMVRYNAAHRGAEEDVFPVATALQVPVVTYTGLRWRALLEGTPDDPPGFAPPRAPDWYRFVLSHPAVAVGLMAPENRVELEENLAILDPWRALENGEHEALAEHGERVRRNAQSFP